MPPGRKRGSHRDNFEDTPPNPAYKGPRVRCKFCKTTVSASTSNMKTHASNCHKIPRPLHRLQSLGRPEVADLMRADPTDANAASQVTNERQRIMAQHKKVGPTIAELLDAKVFPNFTEPEKMAIGIAFAFAAAMHESSCELMLFDHPTWQDFIKLAMPYWNTPPPMTISTDLLDATYVKHQMQMLEALHKSPAIVIGIDAATNVLSKSKTNIIAHDPQGWFVEFLPIDLQKETADSMADKVTSSITELHRLIGRRLVTALISDSCNTMCLLRTTLVDTGVVTHAYGCAAHPLHNLCEDLIKIPLTKAIFTSSVFISKRIRNQGLCNKIFSSVCTELLGKPLAMVLYSATRWSSTN